MTSPDMLTLMGVVILTEVPKQTDSSTLRDERNQVTFVHGYTRFGDTNPHTHTHMHACRCP